ncbi:beta-lactamase family protein [Xylariaceae sp. FL0255]|nr:beta-lactamase family protein [Xylariaceae sp. FL0255]
MDFFRSKRFSARIRRLMELWHVPGLAVAVVQGEEIESKGYGVANLASAEPVTGSTLFDVASVSKSFTAAAVGLLVAEKNYPEVQYTATMSSLLPDDFVMYEEGYTECVTLEDILSHRTGLPGHDRSYLKSDTPRSVTRNLRNLKVVAPLRSRWMYCNQMYTVAAHLIEERTGQKFSDFLEERIFSPLQMGSTSLQPSRAHEKGHGGRIATGYRWIGSEPKATTDSDSSILSSSENLNPRSSYRAMEVFNHPVEKGAGSILTSADDLIKWGCPITGDVYRGMTRMRAIVDPSGEWQRRHGSAVIYAAGLEMYHYRGHAAIGHDGCVSGFASRFVFLPELDFGVCLMGNSQDVKNFSDDVCRMLLDAALGVGEKKIVASQINSQSETTEPSTESNNENIDVKFKEQLSGLELGLPLTAYTGIYRNSGYHDLEVRVTKDGRLFIDASNRSMGFILMFEHFRTETHFNSRVVSAIDGVERHIIGNFILSVDGAVDKMGLHLEPMMHEMIWFDHVVDWE